MINFRDNSAVHEIKLLLVTPKDKKGCPWAENFHPFITALYPILGRSVSHWSW